MPVIAEDPTNELRSTSNEERQDSPQVAEQNVRELTQNDHINRQLLKSFLQRLNTGTLPRSLEQSSGSGNQQNDSFDES